MKIVNQPKTNTRDLQSKDSKKSLGNGGLDGKSGNVSAFVELGNRSNKVNNVTYQNPIFQAKQNNMKSVAEENSQALKNTDNIKTAQEKLENLESKSLQTVFKGIKALTSIMKPA